MNIKERFKHPWKRGYVRFVNRHVDFMVQGNGSINYEIVAVKIPRLLYCYSQQAERTPIGSAQSYYGAMTIKQNYLNINKDKLKTDEYITTVQIIKGE